MAPETGLGKLVDGDDASMSVGVPLFFFAMLFDVFGRNGTRLLVVTSSPAYS